MSDQKYEIHVLVPPELVGTIVELLKDDRITVTRMRPLAEEKPRSTRHPYVGGKRDKGIKSTDLMHELLRHGPQSIEIIERAFVKRGFAVGTVSPTISRMKAEGLVSLDGKVCTLSADWMNGGVQP